MTGDIASELVAGADRFLLREIAESTAKRARYWKRDFSSIAAYNASVEPNRKRLAHILGVRDQRVRIGVDPQRPLSAFPEVGPGSVKVRVQWPAFGDVTGESVFSNPYSRRSDITIIVIPDANDTPEQLDGWLPGVPPESQVARRLIPSGYEVYVPALIDRTAIPRNGRAKLTNREFIYRSAFEMGRHIIGYEVQKVLALVDQVSQKNDKGIAKTRVAVFGHGEGGAIALYAAALDPRIEAVCVSGYFDNRNDVWQQPIDRNVFGLLEQFGDAEVASLIAPRPLIVEAAKGPEFVIPPGTGGAPGRLTTPKLESVRAEVERARSLVSGLKLPKPSVELVVSGSEGTGPFGTR